MNHGRSILLTGLLTVLLLTALTVNVWAADVDVLFSDPGALVGNDVTVRAYTDKEIAGISMTLVYDGEYLTYTGFSGGLGGGDVKDNGGALTIVDYSPNGSGKLSLELHFTANKAGTTTLRPTACMVSDAGGDTMEVEFGSHSSVVTISTASQSKNCELSAIYIYPGTLMPAFSSTVTSYAVTVPYETTWLAVTPEKADGDASAEISDNSLQVGENTITITVTAPAGNRRSYTLHVTRLGQDGITASPVPPAQVTPTPGPELTPEPAGNVLGVRSESYTILPAENAPVTPEGCAVGNCVINGRTYRAFLPGISGEEYAVFYARRDGGEPTLYLYDIPEGTMQRYELLPRRNEESPAPAPTPSPEGAEPEGPEQTLLRKMRLKMGFFAAASAVLLAATVTMGLFLGRKRR